MEEESQGWGIVVPFDVDHGQLDDVRQNECFVLGYEFAQVIHLLGLPEGIDRPVHAFNRERIDKACRREGRDFSLTWCEGDSSEEWMRLVVAPLTHTE